MSAWLCSQEHINLIVNAHPDPERRNGQSFHLLLNENLRSLEAHYPGRDFLEEWKNYAKDYKFDEVDPRKIVKGAYDLARTEDYKVRGYPAIAKPLTQARLRAQIRKACDCFDYQACETGESYYLTPAAIFVNEVRAKFERNDKLENEALWGLD